MKKGKQIAFEEFGSESCVCSMLRISVWQYTKS